MKFSPLRNLRKLKSFGVFWTLPEARNEAVCHITLKNNRYRFGFMSFISFSERVFLGYY